MTDNDSKTLAIVKEQCGWIAERLDRTEKKVDVLGERLNLTIGKLFGACAVVSILCELAVYFLVK